MYDSIGRLMDWRAALIMSGRFEDLSREHLYPMPVYIGDRMRALASPRELEAAFRGVRHGLLAAGATALSAQVTAVEVPRKGRFRVWVDWVARLAGEKSLLVASTVEYMCTTDAGLRTEMSECTCPPVLQIAAAAR
jgi:hypothetical protein